MSNPAHRTGPWRDLPGAASLRAWRDADLERLGASVSAALAAWCGDWDLPACFAAPVRCVAAGECLERDAAWKPLGRNADGVAWMCAPEGRAQSLAAAWVGDAERSSPLLRAIAADCAADADRRLAALFRLAEGMDPEVPGSAIWNSWSGAVVAQLPGECALLLEAGVVRLILQPETPPFTRQQLVRVTQAVAPRALRLQVELDGCQLPLGDLATLQIGDVLRLRHPVAAPAHVRNEAAGILFDGWLARSRGRRAVELALHGAKDKQTSVEDVR